MTQDYQVVRILKFLDGKKDYTDKVDGSLSEKEWREIGGEVSNRKHYRRCHPNHREETQECTCQERK